MGRVPCARVPGTRMQVDGMAGYEALANMEYEYKSAHYRRLSTPLAVPTDGGGLAEPGCEAVHKE